MRTFLPLTRKNLSDTWRGLAGWSLALAAVCLLYLPLYPSMGGGSQMQELLNQMPKELISAIGYDSIGTGAGWTQSTVFGLLGFVLLIIASVSWGAAAIGGNEESGALELTLAHAVTRTQVVLEQALAILIKLVVLGLVVTLIVLSLNSPAELDLNVGYLLGTVALWLELGLLGASVALLCGAATGRRSVGIAGGAIVMIGAYILNALGNQKSDWDWMHNLSPYSWVFTEKPLQDGPNMLIGLALLGIAALATAGAAVVLNKRDVGT